MAERVGPPESVRDPRFHGNLPTDALVASGGEVVVAEVAEGAAWKGARNVPSLVDVLKLDAGDQLRVHGELRVPALPNTRGVTVADPIEKV